MLGNSWVAERILTSQEGYDSKEFIIIINFKINDFSSILSMAPILNIYVPGISN
jgi:hypothetical protein